MQTVPWNAWIAWALSTIPIFYVVGVVFTTLVMIVSWRDHVASAEQYGLNPGSLAARNIFLWPQFWFTPGRLPEGEDRVD